MADLQSFIRLVLEQDLTDADNFLYAYVPTEIVPMVEKYGLLAGRALLNHPDALKELGHALGMSPMTVRASIRSSGASHLGPKVLFQPPPYPSALSPNHPNRSRPSTLIRIDWQALRRDFPGTRLWGMEVASGMDMPTNRWLSDEEAERYMSIDAEELWRGYSDPDDSGDFAPGVPHARIKIVGNTVPPDYLMIV